MHIHIYIHIHTHARIRKHHLIHYSEYSVVKYLRAPEQIVCQRVNGCWKLSVSQHSECVAAQCSRFDALTPSLRSFWPNHRNMTHTTHGFSDGCGPVLQCTDGVIPVRNQVLRFNQRKSKLINPLIRISERTDLQLVRRGGSWDTRHPARCSCCLLSWSHRVRCSLAWTIRKGRGGSCRPVWVVWDRDIGFITKTSENVGCARTSTRNSKHFPCRSW